MKCFIGTLPHDQLDRVAFTFKHGLVGHPALTLDNLERVLPSLPQQQVFYSKGLLKESDNFDTAHVEHSNGLSLRQTIETIRTSNSYIMVRSPEGDASFDPLFRDLKADVEELMRARGGVGTKAVDAMLYLFIASPNSLTPFHIDRYSTILMQFNGSKQVCVFPQWDERVVTAADCEDYMCHTGHRPEWHESAEPLASRFHFKPGDALHIPFMAGHLVRNGADEVSISMSIIFNTAETVTQMKALMLNQRLRAPMRRLGLALRPVGANRRRDKLKAGLWNSAAHVAHATRFVFRRDSVH
jgi:hypothetical protein